MTAKHSQTRIDTFLAALAQTGNQTLACAQAKVSRSWLGSLRATEPAFDAACRDTIAAARQFFDRLRASGAGGRRPAGKWPGHG